MCRLAMRRVFFECRYQHVGAWRSRHMPLYNFFRGQRFPVELFVFFFVLPHNGDVGADFFTVVTVEEHLIMASC